MKTAGIEVECYSFRLVDGSQRDNAMWVKATQGDAVAQEQALDTKVLVGPIGEDMERLAWFAGSRASRKGMTREGWH